MVLVVLEPRGLLAEVPLRVRMRLVAANAREAPTFDLDLQAAVARAQDARGAFRFDSSVGLRSQAPSTMTTVIV